MQETTFQTTRLTLTKEERSIAKSWSMWWNYFGRTERQYGYVRLLFGNWSGYTSSQQRITHVDACYFKELPDDYHATVEFTDGTTMNVWIEKITRKEIIRRKLRKNPTYDSLIHKLIKSGKNYYRIADENKTINVQA